MPEGLRRLIALLIAVVLVVAALIWRRGRDDDKTSVATTTTTTPIPASIICATELEAVCRKVFVDPTIEPAGTTADKLTKTDTPPDLWLTLDPWPAVVASRRGTAALDVETTPLASSRLALVGPADRLAVMQAHCGATKLWSCIGDMSGEEWKTFGGQETWRLVKPAYIRPDLSASGYGVFANAVVAKLGASTFTNLDLDGIKSWGRHLEAGVPTIEPTDQAPLEQLLLGVFKYDLIGVLDTEVPEHLKDTIAVLYPEPMANVAVVAMTRSGFPMPTALPTALQQARWTVPATTTGLPDPNLADAVLAFWRDVKGP
jgi:hypothetical protein